MVKLRANITRLLQAAVIAFCCMAIPLTALALDEFKYDVELVNKLTEIGMTDYASRQIQRLYKKYPSRETEINFARAQVYFADNQYAKAVELLARIPPSNQYYVESRKLLGKNAFQRRNFSAAQKAFKEYFKAQPKPKSPNLGDVKDFITAVQMYAQVFVELGQPEKVGEALDYLGEVGQKANISEAELAFLKARASLAAYELLRNKGREINRQNIKRIIEDLEKLETTTDYMVIINATLESAHAKLMLGQYIPAIKKIRTLDDLLSSAAEQVSPQSSPLANAFLYEGRALAGLARQALDAGERDRARKLFQAAAKRFKRVTDNFKKHQLYEKALIQFGELQTILQKEFGIKLEGGATSATLLAKLKKADELFQNDQYEQAIKPYLNALREGRLSGKAPEIGLRLAYCYAKTQQYLKAQAVSDYVLEAFPDSKRAAEAVLYVGSQLYEKAKNTENVAEKENLISQAMKIWDKFVSAAPDHPKAPDIAFAIAENQYRIASQAAARLEKTKDPQKRREVKNKAEKLYRQVIPYYERLIEKFQTSPRGIRAYYKLGWVYYALEQKKQAAEAFLKYYVLENNPDRAGDRIRAKYYAAHQLMMSDTPARAIGHFQEFIKLIEDGKMMGIKTADVDAQKLKINAESYLAWAYDMTAETLQPDISKIDEQIRNLRQQIAKLEAQLENQQADKKAAEEFIADTEEAWQTQKKKITADLPSPEAQARVQFKDDLEEAGSEQDKAQVRARMESEAEKNREQILTTLSGEKQELEKTKASVQQQYLADRKEIKNLEEKLRKTRETITDLQSQYDDVNEKLKIRQKEIAESRARVEELETKIAEAQEKYKNAREAFQQGNAEEKRKARAMGMEVQKQLSEWTPQLKNARNKLAILTTEEQQKVLEDLRNRKAVLQADIQKNKSAAADLERQSTLLEKEVAIADARKQALQRTIERIELQRELVQVPEDQRQQQAEQKGWKEVQTAELAAYEEVKNQRIAKGRIMLAAAEKDIKNKQEEIAQKQTRVSKLKQKKTPIVEKIEKWKEKAAQTYIAFIEQYPKSKHVPSNLGRLGTNFMERGEYQKAEKYLNKLARDYPEAKALETAMFSLAKAQLETGRKEEAAASFKKILQDKQTLGVGSLSYIARELLDAGYPEIALSAAEELLRRSNTESHEDYEQLSGKTKETLLYRAGVAAFKAEQYKKAEKHLSQLLEVNEKTSRYFEVKMILGRAKRLMSPPDLSGSRNDMIDVVQYSDDPILQNRAILEAAKTYIAMGTAKSVNQALGQIGQLTLVADGEALILANEEKKENLPLLEEAFYLSAKCYALLGKKEQRDLMTEAYQEKYPNGKFLDELNNLPDQKYQTKKPAPTAEEN
ncbi:MAG: tetratricopeptide repeat protein [Lentisphaeria bacterium]